VAFRKDLAPGPGDFPPPGPFDLFGFGQFGPGPFAPPNQQINDGHPENGIPRHGFVDPMEQLEQDDELQNGPQAEIEFPDFDLNNNPDAPLVLDLNEPADMEEMVVDPVFIGPLPPVNDLVVQVNEIEEDAQLVVEGNAPVAMPGIQENHEVIFPAALNPMMPMEIQEEDLMNDDDIQQQLQDEAELNDAIGPNNVQVGLVLIKDAPLPNLSSMMAPGLDPFCLDSLLSPFNQMKKGPDPFSPWDSFFAPSPNSAEPVFYVPNEWTKFFTSVLLSPKYFSLGKDLIQSKAFLDCISSEDGNNGFAFCLPKKCPAKKAPSCSLQEILQESTEEVDVISSEAPPVDSEAEPQKRKGKKDPVLVESEVRRSPRVKLARNGFKNLVCKDKNCIGCTSKPPPLSNKVIRKLSSSLYDVECSLVTDNALKNVKTVGAPGKREKNAGMGNLKAKRTPGGSSSPKTEAPQNDDADA
jgi:hypothetical protein